MQNSVISARLIYYALRREMTVVNTDALKLFAYGLSIKTALDACAFFEVKSGFHEIKKVN